MLEEKLYKCIDTGFPFIFEYSDRDTGHIEDTELTQRIKMSSEFLIEMYPRGLKRNTDLKVRISPPNGRVRELKHIEVLLFEDNCECGQFVMKFNLFNSLYVENQGFITIKF